MVTVRCLNSFQEVLTMKKDWDDLLIRSGNQSIFMTWTWLITWWEVYGENNELWWMYVADERGRFVGSAPLYLRKQTNGLLLPHREIRFIGTGAPVSPEHLDILVDPMKQDETFDAIGKYLDEHRSHWDVLLLTDLTVQNVSPATLNLAGELSSVQIEEQFPRAPYIPLPDRWEDYFKSLGKWLRRTIARQRNKQTRELDMSFYVWSPKDSEFDAAFSQFEKLYALRKESVQVENKFAQAYGYLKFHRLLASRLADEGRLNLAFLKIQGKEVACEYTFKHRNKLYSYQCGFDPAFAKHNIFKVLRSYVIEVAIKQGIKEFDLLRGEESYKYDWKALPRKKQMLRAFSPTFYGSTLKSVLGLRRTGRQILNQINKKEARQKAEAEVAIHEN